jgi:hypothetical protein
LVALLSGSAVTARRFTTDHANEFSVLTGRNFYFRSRTAEAQSQEQGNRTQPTQDSLEHALDAIGNSGSKPFQIE